MSEMETPPPAVSVLLLVFNHGKFIRQALESIFAQQLDFPVELLIGEDCSNDDSRARIEEFLAEQNHRWITVRRIYHTTNVGMHGNARILFAEARGRYVALLEGDDFWTDPEKLRRQVAVLEADAGCYLVAHASNFLWENRGGAVESMDIRWNRHRTRFDVRDHIREYFFHTSSILMRNVRAGWPTWLNSVKQLDQFLVMIHARPGCERIVYLPQVMSVYRKHDGGITRSAEHRDNAVVTQSMIDGLSAFDGYSSGRYSGSVRRRIEDIVLKRDARGPGRWLVRLRSPGAYLRRVWFRVVRSL